MFNSAYVCWIGADMIESFFGGDLVGEQLYIAGVLFLVAGILSNNQTAGERYGVVMYIEGESVNTISASTDDAYNATANKFVHVGEVEETIAGQLTPGDSAELIYICDRTETSISGTIAFISPVAENDLYAVRISPEALPSRLNLTVNVRIGE